MLASVTTFAFAEDAAPVYDADNMPSQFDGASSENASSSAVTSPAPAVAVPTAQQEQAYFPSPTLTLEQRIGRVEQQLTNLQHSTGSAKTDELQTEVQTLRGQVEQLNHQIQQLQAQNQQLQNSTRSMYSDLEKRVKKTPHETALASTDELTTTDDTETKAAKKSVAEIKPADKEKNKENEKTIASTESPKSADTEIQPNVAEEQQTYQTAYDLIKAKKYNDAIAALQKMLQKYPSGQFAANAHYWLGELYGLTGKSEQSSKEFNTIVNDFPSSPKVSDAQLKLGMIYASDLKWREAKAAFKKVVSRYPGTASAHLASEQLKQLKVAGH